MKLEVGKSSKYFEEITLDSNLQLLTSYMKGRINLINFIIIALKVIFLLGFLIFIHEGGHFIVAKLCKVKVNEFAIGFGPTIWRKQGKETKYALRLIPLGGFVNLEGEEERVESSTSFSETSIPKRMAIIVAGGLVNIVFGLLVYFILMASIGNNTSLVVENTIPQYAAENAGIVLEDKIVKINNKKINVKSDIDKILEKSNGEELQITIIRNGEEKQISLTPTAVEYKNTGIYLKNTLDEEKQVKIISVSKGSSAEKQGIKANDKIIKINGIQIKSGQDIANAISESENNEEIEFTIKRGNDELEIKLIPDTMYQHYIGIQFKQAENSFTNNIYYSIFETRNFAFSIIDNIKMLFSGNVGLDQMMGPVGISEAVANTSGLKDFIYLLALISLSLGVTNLLPFPALDGGKFALLILEAIRGKKLKQETEINLQLLGFAILIVLALYITYNDILRMF